MRIMAAFPESDFIALSAIFMEGRAALHHLMRIEFGDEGGIVVLPKEVGRLPPARFRLHSCLSTFARGMGGKPDESGDQRQSILLDATE